MRPRFTPFQRWLQLAAVSLCLVLVLAGCAIGKAGDGSYVAGFPVGAANEDAQDAANLAAGTIGTMLGGPAGQAIGLGVVGIVGSMLGWRTRATVHTAENRGYDEGAARTAVQLAPGVRGGVPYVAGVDAGGKAV